MYPERELNRLAARKAVLTARIALRRLECAEAAVLALRPVRWLDVAREILIRIRPVALLAAVPVALLAEHSKSRIFRFLGPVIRLAPLIFGGANAA
jgi:hypothetical protein